MESSKKLSLLAQYDDMCRFSNSFVTTEKEFKEILINFEYNRQIWYETKQKFDDASKRILELESLNSELQRKLSRLRYAYGQEIRKYEEKEKECFNLRHVVDIIRDFVNDESKDSGQLKTNASITQHQFKNRDFMLSILNTSDFSRFTNSSKTLNSNSIFNNERNEEDIQDDLNFDKTEDSINVSRLNETTNNCNNQKEEHQFFEHDRISESRQTYYVDQLKNHSPTISLGTGSTKEICSSNDSNNGNPDNKVNRKVTIKCDSGSPTSIITTTSSTVYSEDYNINIESKNDLLTDDESNQIDVQMTDSETDEKSKPIDNNHVEYDKYETPKSRSSPYVPLAESARRYYFNSVKATPRIKVDLDRLDKRPHNLQLKKVFKPMFCVPCGKNIGFCSKCLVCVDCRTIAHVNCENNLSLPCIPHYTPRGLSRSGTHTHMLMIGDFTAPDTRPFVPPLLVHCCNEIERRGINEQGIYRKCGSDREVRELKQKFLHSKTGPPNVRKVDIHVLCGVVKLFLRDLDDPLITRILWHDFVRATDSSNNQVSTELLERVIEQLPDSNRDSLAFLILHLQKVANNSSVNRMTVKSLSKMFGPTAIGYSISNPPLNSMMAENVKQIRTMESLLDLPTEFWERTLKDPQIFKTPVSSRTSKSKRIKDLKSDSQGCEAVMSPCSYRSASSSLYATPRGNLAVTRFTPIKRNKLFLDPIY